MDLEAKLVAHLETVLTQEELLWQQRSRCDYVQLGDRNTRYFHNKTKVLQGRSRINSLKDANGNWCFDSELLKHSATNYYCDLFTKKEGDAPVFQNRGYFPPLTYEDSKCMGDPISREEVKTSLFEMGPSKASGKDGFNAFFLSKSMGYCGGVPLAVCQIGF